MDDDTLVLEARRGGRAALELLVTRHYDAVYAYALRRTGSVPAAQDIAQMTFERVVAALPRYRPTGRFRAWLFAVAGNAVADYYRTRPPVGELTEELADPSDTVRLLIRREEYGRIRRAILALPPAQQEALILFYYHDLPLKDIARLSGAGINTVKSRLRLAVTKLRQELEAEHNAGRLE